jgi:UMF1 family MFS transporter
MTVTAISGNTAPAAGTGRASVASWMLFDWAAQPFYTLITIFLVAPYFANAVIGDASRGAAIFGYAKAASAILVAIGAPLLGAMADTAGRLKPMILGWSIPFVIGQGLLWYATPSAPSAAVWIVLAGLIMATLAGEFTAMLNNALMPRIVSPGQLGRVSGGGMALGYVGGLISLVLMAGFVLTDARTGRTLLGLEPVFALDAAMREADRLVGPFCAVWYAVFVIPFFLFTPDARSRARVAPTEMRLAFSPVRDGLAHLRRHRQIAVFLVARMLFIDGLLAIFIFGGIYAASVFGWQTIVTGYFGILLSIAAGIGAAAGGFLDDWLGSERLLMGSLVLLIIGLLGTLSVDETSVLFALEVTPKLSGSGPFASTSELAYLAFSALIGIAAGPLQSASRSLLARMAPAERMAEFFGLFAFSGKATAFAAPLLIGTISGATGSLRVGMSAILPFLLAGLVVMAFVKEDRASRAVRRDRI